MSRIPLEVKRDGVVMVVISQGSNSGFIDNETENWEEGCFCNFVGFFSFCFWLLLFGFFCFMFLFFIS